MGSFNNAQSFNINDCVDRESPASWKTASFCTSWRGVEDGAELLAEANNTEEKCICLKPEDIVQTKTTSVSMAADLLATQAEELRKQAADLSNAAARMRGAARRRTGLSEAPVMFLPM